jgi:SAM-dependent methyltransferase
LVQSSSRDCCATWGGPDDVAEAYRSSYQSWWLDHAGRRASVFREQLLPILKSVGCDLAGKRLLDFGCGTGSSSVVFAEAGATVTGLEPDVISLDVAEQRVADLGLSDRIQLHAIPYLAGADARLPLASDQFDVAMLMGVLEHMLPAERGQCVREIHRLLKPGGTIVIYDTPNRFFPFDHHTTQLFGIGFLPMRLAYWYACKRGRIDKSSGFTGFLRRGATGISRGTLDRLFQKPAWVLRSEREDHAVANELAWAATKAPLWHRLRDAELRAKRPARVVVKLLKAIGIRPSRFAGNHVLTYECRK